MIGKVGRVTGRVGPGLVGEIMVSVRGGSEAFYAHPQRPDEEIEPGAQVLIVDFQVPRTAYVERWQWAGAGALGNVDHMVVLNGADGVADLLTKALAMGGTGLGLARQLLGAMSEKPDAVSGNGAAPAPTLLEKTPTPKPRHD